MLNLYWGVFVAGIAFAILSLVFNFVGDFLNFEFTAGDIFLPVKPFFILIFMTVFGGVGIIASNYLGQWLAFAPACVILAKKMKSQLNVTVHTR